MKPVDYATLDKMVVYSAGLVAGFVRVIFLEEGKNVSHKTYLFSSCTCMKS